MSGARPGVHDPRCACGACRGVDNETPVRLDNRPGLSTVAYRVGDHARFKASLLAGLSRSPVPALRVLTTRSDDDFCIALLDAFAVMADVLTFYQERIANESWLRTATERLSVGYIARLIGYELRPGSAARASLAFTMQEGVGAVEKLRLPVGTRVQSTPGPDQNPQVFETVEEVEVRPAWNQIPAKALEQQKLDLETDHVRLKGGASNVRPGDGVLLVFPDESGDAFTAVFRRVRAAHVEPQGKWTEVSLLDAQSKAIFGDLTPPQTGVFLFRRNASLFGYNAPEFTILKKSGVVPDEETVATQLLELVQVAHVAQLGPSLFGLLGPLPNLTKDDWNPASTTGPDTFALDSLYHEVVIGTWGVWQSPEKTSPSIFLVKTAQEDGVSSYALTGKITRITADRGKNGSTIQVGSFAALRGVSVLVQPEKLELAEAPVEDPVAGDTLVLARKVEGLEKGRKIAIQGKRLRAEVLEDVTLLPTTGPGSISAEKPLHAGDRRDLVKFPRPVLESIRTEFALLDDGGVGLVKALPGQVRRVEGEDGVELATIADVEIGPDATQIVIDPPLANRYDPPTVTVNANVADATHGETVNETFEGGDATRPFQRFPLKQTPLTYVAATTPAGVRSTLRVWVDEVEWHEVPFLYGRGPTDRVFVVRRDGEEKTWIHFGDGVTGARLPSGQRNVRAEYRRGIGADGILAAGQINVLLSRPAGLKDAANPLPSADGKDPEALDDARRNAPLTVLTLDRVVSLQDFEDFARAFAGVYKARATWTWIRNARGVFLTVVGFQGAALSLLGRRQLRAAIAEWGDPFVPVAVENHAAATFRTGLRAKVDPDREAKKVLAAVEARLRSDFSFDARSFGQAVWLGEIAAAAQAVPGVIAVQVARLYRSGDPNPAAGLTAGLAARAPQPGERGEVLPAELLTLDPAPLDLLEELP